MSLFYGRAQTQKGQVLEELAAFIQTNMRHIKKDYLVNCENPRKRGFCLRLAHSLALKLSEDKCVDNHFLSKRKDHNKSKVISTLQCIARDIIQIRDLSTVSENKRVKIANDHAADYTMAQEVLAICKMYCGKYD